MFIIKGKSFIILFESVKHGLFLNIFAIKCTAFLKVSMFKFILNSGIIYTLNMLLSTIILLDVIYPFSAILDNNHKLFSIA